MTDHVTRAEHIERARTLPALEDKVTDDHSVDELAEVCTAVETELREECQGRDIGKHGGILCLYMVIERLSGDRDD